MRVGCNPLIGTALVAARAFPGHILPIIDSHDHQCKLSYMPKVGRSDVGRFFCLFLMLAAGALDGAQFRLDSPHYTNGEFRFHITNAPGSRYVIYSSANLSAWTALATNSVSATTFADTNAGSFPSRFYRLLSLPSVGAIRTVWIVMMENIDWSTFKGNPNAPFINSLLPRFAHAENYRSYNHPSLPNYVTLEAGDNLGLTNGAWLPGSAHSQSTTDHLTTYLKNKGITWKAYSENLPGNGSILPLFDGPGYSLDHNPFVYFYDVTGNPPSTNSAYGIAHVRPYETEFARDLASNNVASYNFIVPNDYNQGEKLAPPLNNLVQQADTWLSHEIPKIMAAPAYTNGGVIFILWDEGVSPANNPSGLIVVSQFAKVGYSNALAYTHASMVRTVEEIFGLTPLLRLAATASNLSDLFAVYP